MFADLQSSVTRPSAQRLNETVKKEIKGEARPGEGGSTTELYSPPTFMLILHIKHLQSLPQHSHIIYSATLERLISINHLELISDLRPD